MKFRNALQAFLVAVLAFSACSEKPDDAIPTAECPQPDGADMTEITQVRADLLVGFSEADAESCAVSLGWVFRVGERDGEGFALTADYSQQRVTVSVTNDLVTAVAVG